MLMISSLGPTLVVVVAFAHYTLIAKQELTASIAFVSLPFLRKADVSCTDLDTDVDRCVLW